MKYVKLIIIFFCVVVFIRIWVSESGGQRLNITYLNAVAEKAMEEFEENTFAGSMAKSIVELMQYENKFEWETGKGILNNITAMLKNIAYMFRSFAIFLINPLVSIQIEVARTIYVVVRVFLELAGWGVLDIQGEGLHGGR